MKTGLILFSTEVTSTNGFKVVKVIEPVYQIMYELAQQSRSVADKQARIYKKLIEWVDEAYSGWGIQNFIDLSIAEANAINSKRISDVVEGPLELIYEPQLLVSWGMYILLQQGTGHVHRRTQINQIEDNTTTNHAIRNE